MKGEAARDGDEERVIAVEEVIVLDEGTTGVEEERNSIQIIQITNRKTACHTTGDVSFQ